MEAFSLPIVQEAVGKHKRLRDALGEARSLGHWEPPVPQRRKPGPMIRDPYAGRG